MPSNDTIVNLYVHVGSDVTMERGTDVEDDDYLIISIGDHVQLILDPESVKQWSEGLFYHNAQLTANKKQDGQTQSIPG